MSKYLKSFLGIFSSKLLRAGLNLSFIALLARLLGPDGLGQWTMIMATGTALHLILLSWMHAPAVRFGCEEWLNQKTITTTWSSRAPFLLAGFILASGLIFLDPNLWIERFFHVSVEFKLAILFSFVGIWLCVETQNCQQLRGSILRLAVVPLCVDCVSFIVLITLFISGIIISDHALITGLLMLSVVLWAPALWWELMRLDIRWTRPKIEFLKKIFVYSLPLIPGLIFGYVSDWGDQLLLRHFFTAHEVGLFQAAYQFMVLLLGVATPIGMILLPKLIDKEILSTENTKDFLNSAGPTVITLGFFLLIPIVSFAPLFFGILMGHRFVGAYSLVFVLCAAIPGSILANFYGTFFKLQGRLWRSNVVYFGIMSVLNIIISLILLPRIGMIGSAIATSISYLMLQFLYLIDQHRFYKISLFKGYILFSFILVFSVSQIFVGNLILARCVLCLFSLVALIFLARVGGLLDSRWVLRVFSGNLNGLGKLLVRIAIPQERQIHHA